MVLEGLDEFVTGKQQDPSEVELIWYFFADRGIGYTEFAELPLPYIFSVLKSHNYVSEKKEEHYKKQNRRL